MKTALKIFVLMFAINTALMAQTYTAKILVYDQTFVTPENPNSIETNVNVEIQLYYNGNPIPKSSEYYYKFYRRNAGITLEPFELRNEGWGLHRAGTHAYTDSTYGAQGKIDWYGVVSYLGDEQNITVTTDTIRTPWWKVVSDQKKSDNSSYGVVKFWKNGGFTNNHNVPDTFFIPRYSPKVLLADTNLTVSGTEKYHQWDNIVTSAKEWYNNYNFTPLKPIEKFNARLMGANVSTFNIKIDSVPLTVSNTLEFSDPWLRDSTNAYGKLNRSYDAVFRKQTAPFSPNTNSSGAGSEYRGVFLNQLTTTGFPYYITRTKRNGDFNGKKLYFRNWSSSNAQLTSPTYFDGTYYETPVVFNANNSSVMAYYKGSLFSNQSSAFANTSQRKTIGLSTSYGNRLFVVYESMGKIWIEYSTDKGATWELGNNRQPVNEFAGKLPSLTAFNSSNTLAIVYQDYDGYDGLIMSATYDVSSNLISERTVIGVSRSANGNGNPVVAHSFSGDNTNARIMFAWEQNDGIHYMLVKTNGAAIQYGVFDLENQPKVSGTDGNSLTPTLSGGWTTHYYNFQLAWSQNNADIKYVKIQQYIASTFEPIAFGTTENVSSGGGYAYNYGPSIISWVSNSQNNDSRIAWVGKRWVSDEEMQKSQTSGHWEYKCVFRATPVSGSSPFFHFGETDVSSCSVNKVATTYTMDLSYIVGWSQGNGNYFTRNSQLSGQNPIPGLSVGYALQLGQGTDTVRALAQQTQSGYYTIKQSTQGISKQDASHGSFSGREGIITSGKAQFYFALGDVVVDGQTIQFTEITDTTSVKTLTMLNSLLETKPFVLQSTSDFTYGVQYGVADSLSAIAGLINGKEISFKVELINHNTNEVIGIYDQVMFNESNVFQYRNTAYQVLTEDMDPMVVRLRLIAVPNFETGFYVANKTSSDFMLAKGNRRLKKINYKGALAIYSYTLEQNFPNPFNPITTVSYALPRDGHVTIKIYDALGREVTTLVNEFKSTGRYTVNFDASRLSSGTYIYKLISGGFSATKKMILVK